jgi:hypothetical protein
VREICTPGSAWGDGHKEPCRLGEATASKGAAPARLRKGYRSKACPYQPCHRPWMVGRFIKHRVGDSRVVRLIQKWLAAGVMENGEWTSSEVGSPQGATASPLLANVYLHDVLDLWAQQWRTKVARGDVIIVRYADDCAPRRRGEEAVM